MFCHNCGTKISDTAKFCGSCGKEIIQSDSNQETTKIKSDNTESVTKNLYQENKIPTESKIIKPEKKSFAGKFLWIFIVIVILGLLGSYFEAQDQEESQKEVSTILNDAIKNTDTAADDNQKYVKYLRGILNYYKDENEKMFPSCLAIEDSDILEFSSYETNISLNLHIGNLKKCLAEYENFEQKYDNLLDSSVVFAEQSAKNYGFSSEDTEDVLKGYKSKLYNTEKRRLAVNRAEALVAHYEKILEVYEFLSDNYYDYEIGPDEYGLDTVLFYTDASLDGYNRLAGQTDITSANYLAAEKALNDYMTSRLDEQGLDVDIDDINNFMYE
jgi:hypothetical protein